MTPPTPTTLATIPYIFALCSVFYLYVFAVWVREKIERK